jgi:predicted nucleotide-binding protein
MAGRKSLTNAIKRSTSPSLSSAVKQAVSGVVDIEPARSLAAAIKQSADDVRSATLSPKDDVLNSPQSTSPQSQPTPARRVFVVHGHDELSKAKVVRFLEQMQFEAIVLNEQSNQGRTIIEKIESYRDVGFAVVLLTPDDECISTGIASHRARQNVIWELGYFTALIGRNKVCVLREGDVELPSDISGVVVTELDARGGWQLDLARELKEAGFSVSIPL